MYNIRKVKISAISLEDIQLISAIILNAQPLDLPRNVLHRTHLYLSQNYLQQLTKSKKIPVHVNEYAIFSIKT